MTNELCQRWRSFTRRHDEYRDAGEHTKASDCVDLVVNWLEGYAAAMRDNGYFEAASDALFLSSMAIERDALFFREYLDACHG